MRVAALAMLGFVLLLVLGNKPLWMPVLIVAGFQVLVIFSRGPVGHVASVQVPSLNEQRPDHLTITDPGGSLARRASFRHAEPARAVTGVDLL